MEDLQTEIMSSYDQSRNKRRVDGNLQDEDSANEDDYCASGFYVREKNEAKTYDTADSSCDTDTKANGCKENGNVMTCEKDVHVQNIVDFDSIREENDKPDNHLLIDTHDMCNTLPESQKEVSNVQEKVMPIENMCNILPDNPKEISNEQDKVSCDENMHNVLLVSNKEMSNVQKKVMCDEDINKALPNSYNEISDSEEKMTCEPETENVECEPEGAESALETKKREHLNEAKKSDIDKENFKECGENQEKIIETNEPVGLLLSVDKEKRDKSDMAIQQNSEDLLNITDTQLTSACGDTEKLQGDLDPHEKNVADNDRLNCLEGNKKIVENDSKLKDTTESNENLIASSEDNEQNTDDTPMKNFDLISADKLSSGNCDETKKINQDSKVNDTDLKELVEETKQISIELENTTEVVQNHNSKLNKPSDEPLNNLVELKKSDSVKDDVRMSSKEDTSETQVKEGMNHETKVSEQEDKSSSLLKEQLTRSKLNEQADSAGEPENAYNDEDMDYDFDPSLFCPDISMDVDEAPVITSSDNVPNDGNTSPLPYEPVFSTYVDEMTGAEITFNLTAEELSIREKLFGPNNPIQYTKIHCTACNIHLGSALDGQKNRFVHPLLKVLICKNCYHFYTSGEFEKDEDGSELYCRWCGQGGQVLCCSSCEYVFCKRCIKNNFGLKKFKEIRDSDDWNCFRCDPAQLSILRATCAEFMDYVRREISRASTIIQDVPSFMTQDHTRCCNPTQKKKDGETSAQEPKKRKRKLSCEDPDYNPVVEEVEDPLKKKLVAITGPTGITSTVTVATKTMTPSTAILPKPLVATNSTGNTVSQRHPGQAFRVGNTTFRPRVQQSYTITRPMTPGQVRVSGPGYIKILPQRLNTPRPQNPSYTVMSPSNRPPMTSVRPNILAGRSLTTPTPTHMKHEWFEKTVRAAARVNSNLSYTLTQLNKQTAAASNVEALAVVHNKLQEVLSTSINSLIQIRKNLRTEFIAGIKSIKFPPKMGPQLPPAPPAKDDDDVIFVSPTTSQVTPSRSSITLSPAVTLTTIPKPKIAINDPYLNPIPSTSFASAEPSININSGRKGGYLKVKSFSALQNVPSECITIPDDPPPLAAFRTLDEKTGNLVVLEDPLQTKASDRNDKDCVEVVNSYIRIDDTESNRFQPHIADRTSNAVVEKVAVDAATDKVVVNGVLAFDGISSTCEKFESQKVEAKPTLRSFNLKEDPSPEVKRMFSAVVLISRSKLVDDLIKKKESKLLNGNDKE